MNCAECQLQIFDGELNRDAMVHLTECDDCRALDREVRLNSAALAELRDEPLPAARIPHRWWPYVAAAAAAVLVAAFVLRPVTRPEPVPVAHVEPAPLAAPAFPSLPQLAAAPKPVHHRHLAAKPEPKPAEAEPLLVKFITDDPNVVVYWIVDPQGEPGL
jgi:hypothetical protein